MLNGIKDTVCADDPENMELNKVNATLLLVHVDVHVVSFFLSLFISFQNVYAVCDLIMGILHEKVMKEISKSFFFYLTSNLIFFFLLLLECHNVLGGIPW